MGMHESDEVLATRILKFNNQEARTDLYLKHHRMACAIASRFFQSPDLVDEAVNVSFWKAFDHLAVWNAERERFPAWFQAIVRNTCIDFLRKQQSDRHRFRDLSRVRRGYLQPELFTDDACELHSHRWFDRKVRGFIQGFLERLGHDRVQYIINPPPGRLSALIRARQTRDRHEIAGSLEINAAGRELSRRVTNELLLATCCGKLPGGLIQ